MASNSTKAELPFLQFCGQPKTTTYSAYDYEGRFEGVTPLFACEYAAKTEACNVCDPCDLYYDDFDVSCTCDPDQKYQFIHMIVSVVSDGNKVITTPSNSVYQINIVNGYFKSNQFDAIRLRSDEVEFHATVFSIFDIMEIDQNITQLLKTSTFIDHANICVEKSSSYFYTFDGIAKSDAYYKSFSDLYTAYLKYVGVDEKKDNPHVGRKQKKK
jgi:hypothetical protein